MRKLTNGVVEIVNGTGTNARFQAFVTKLDIEFLQSFKFRCMYKVPKFVYSLACLDVNHVNDNPGHYSCDCVESSDPCLADGGCVLEARCPESDGDSTGIQT